MLDTQLIPDAPKRKLNLVEKKLTTLITTWLKKQEECWFYKIAAHTGLNSGGTVMRQQTGIPDLCVVYRGRSVWLEVKRPGGYLRPNQKEQIAKMIGAGAEVFVVRSLEEVKRILVGE